VAFASGNIEGRTPKPDDIAGMRDIYGTAAIRRETGSVSGRVTKNGTGILGAHVTAFNPRTGKTVAGFSLNENGDFVIAGLEPGPHIVRAEPLDDADLDGFFDEDSEIDLDFRVAYYAKQVAVPAGGSSGDIEIKVRRK
jgi:hypothetical protein